MKLNKIAHEEMPGHNGLDDSIVKFKITVGGSRFRGCSIRLKKNPKSRIPTERFRDPGTTSSNIVMSFGHRGAPAEYEFPQ